MIKLIAKTAILFSSMLPFIKLQLYADNCPSSEPISSAVRVSIGFGLECAAGLSFAASYALPDYILFWSALSSLPNILDLLYIFWMLYDTHTKDDYSLTALTICEILLLSAKVIIMHIFNAQVKRMASLFVIAVIFGFVREVIYGGTINLAEYIKRISITAINNIFFILPSIFLYFGYFALSIHSIFFYCVIFAIIFTVLYILALSFFPYIVIRWDHLPKEIDEQINEFLKKFHINIVEGYQLNICNLGSMLEAYRDAIEEDPIFKPIITAEAQNKITKAILTDLIFLINYKIVTLSLQDFEKFLELSPGKLNPISLRDLKAQFTFTEKSYVVQPLPDHLAEKQLAYNFMLGLSQKDPDIHSGNLYTMHGLARDGDDIIKQCVLESERRVLEYAKSLIKNAISKLIQEKFYKSCKEEAIKIIKSFRNLSLLKLSIDDKKKLFIAIEILEQLKYEDEDIKQMISKITDKRANYDFTVQQLSTQISSVLSQLPTSLEINKRELLNWLIKTMDLALLSAIMDKYIDLQLKGRDIRIIQMLYEALCANDLTSVLVLIGPKED